MSKSLTVEIYRGDQLVGTQTLARDVVKIGKLGSCHLRLDGDAVARMHAVIEVADDGVRVIDLGSSAGTVVNGARIDKHAALREGDALDVGPYRIKLARIADAVDIAAPTRGPVAASQAASAASPSPAPPVNVDLGAVEIQGAGQVAEVVAMYGRTALDVAHVGQIKDRKSSAIPLMAVGGVMLLGGLGLFAYEVNQPWASYSLELREAQQAKKPAPAKPGAGTGALGLGLALLGLVPFVAGGLRLRDKVISDYTIGESHDSVFHVPPVGPPGSEGAAFPLVRSTGGEFCLNFTADMRGQLTLDGQTLELGELVSSGRARSLGSHYSLALPRGARGRVDYRDVSFHINTVNPGAVVAGRGDIDWPFWSYIGGTAVIAVSFYMLMRSIPDQLMAISFDDGDGEPAYARFVHQPDQSKDQQPISDEQELSEDQAGGTGERHAGEEGQAGKPSSQSSSGVYAIKGRPHASPQLDRTFDPDMAARSAGILGVMQQQGGHFLASPYGGAFALGNDDQDVWGGLSGTEVGEAYGVGGLGLVGTGRGGGGTGEGTIGMGHVGTIGKGGGGGSSSGYGPGSGAGFGDRGRPRIPKIRQPLATVTGLLDRDIIRRVVRSHINEVRSCYNAGLTKNPNLGGRVVINFVIAGTGKVTNSVVQESSLKDSSTGNCIAKAVRRWKFPRPQGGNVMVNYPFSLSPG